MIKLIACDLDGTLLDSYMNITAFSAEVIKKCQENGIVFLMATGRDYYMVVEYLEQYDLHCDMILNNGAQYLSGDLKETRFFPIDHQQLNRIIPILQKYDYHISMHTTDGKYIFIDPDQYYQEHIDMIIKERGENILKETNAAFFRKDGFLRHTTQIHSLDEMYTKQVEALKLDCKNPDPEKGRKAMEELKQIPDILLTSSYEKYVEITSSHAHKGKLLESIVQEKGLSKEEVAVFGDSDNDLSMLTLFPNSYAPSNARDSVKEKVKEIILSNNEDGVAKKLQELIDESK